MTKKAAILDMDGTLLDNNYQHALAWHLALRRVDILVPVWKVHRAVGIGSDKIVSELAGDDAEREHGDEVRDHESEIFDSMKDEAIGVEGATEFVGALRERGHRVVLASSGDAEDIEKYVDQLGIGEDLEATVTSGDVDSSKPAPDLVEAALDHLETRNAIMVGDTPWDIRAAARAGIPAVCVLTGGFVADELRDVGAVAVYESVAELAARLDDSPFA